MTNFRILSGFLGILIYHSFICMICTNFSRKFFIRQNFFENCITLDILLLFLFLCNTEFTRYYKYSTYSKNNFNSKQQKFKFWTFIFKGTNEERRSFLSVFELFKITIFQTKIIIIWMKTLLFRLWCLYKEIKWNKLHRSFSSWSQHLITCLRVSRVCLVYIKLQIEK